MNNLLSELSKPLEMIIYSGIHWISFDVKEIKALSAVRNHTMEIREAFFHCFLPALDKIKA